MTALSLKNRLTESEKIGEVVRRGRRFTANGFKAYVKKSAYGTWRAAIVVPKRTDKRAAVRNKLKRRAGEIVKRLIPDSGKSADLVLYLEAESAELSFKELKRSLAELLSAAIG